MHIDRMPVYRAYQRAVDLELYHAFAELVVQTSQDNTAGRTYRQIKGDADMAGGNGCVRLF